MSGLLYAMTRKRIDTRPDLPATKHSERPRAEAASKMVLVVDDDPVALTFARQELERLGVRVHTREHSIGTSEWILKNHPDLVLLDLAMPALSGADLARVVRRHLSIGIVLFSSRPLPELQALASELGAIGAISKTANAEAFADELRRLLGLPPGTEEKKE
jgi:CheY-like chemotaxis protein